MASEMNREEGLEMLCMGRAPEHEVGEMDAWAQIKLQMACRRQWRV